MPLVFECTPRNAPQFNHLSELKLTLLCNKAHSMMMQANVPEKHRHQLFVLAINRATTLDGLVVVDVNGTTATRCEHFFGTTPKFSSWLPTFGEAGVVTTRQKNASSTAD